MKTNKFELSVTDQDFLISLVKEEIIDLKRKSFPSSSYHKLDRLERLLFNLKHPVGDPRPGADERIDIALKLIDLTPFTKEEVEDLMDIDDSF